MSYLVENKLATLKVRGVRKNICLVYCYRPILHDNNVISWFTVKVILSRLFDMPATLFSKRTTNAAAARRCQVAMENNTNKQNTVFEYSLNRRQNAILNHLVPCAIACFLYVLITATDIGVIFRHYKDNDPIWASLTLFVMYLPAIGSFILIVTDCDYWPEPENGMTNENAFWLYKKILGHLLFPLWNIWR